MLKVQTALQGVMWIRTENINAVVEDNAPTGGCVLFLSGGAKVAVLCSVDRILEQIGVRADLTV